jgi:CHAT domain-containing protein
MSGRGGGRRFRRIRAGVLLGAALSCAWLDAVAAVDSCEVPEAPATPTLASNDATLEFERGSEFAARGEFAQALPAYEASRSLAEADGNARLAALATANAARAAIETGAFEDVSADLERSLATIGEFQTDAAKAQLLIHIGRSQALLAARHPPSRHKALRAAADAFKRGSELAGRAGDQRQQSFALGYLGELYERRGRRSEALELTRRAIFNAQLVDAYDALYRWQAQLARLEIAGGNLAAGLASYRNTVATLRELRTQAIPAGFGSFESRVEPIYDEFVDLLLQEAAKADDAEQKQALLVEAREALEDLKTAELRDYFGDSCLDAQRIETPDNIPNTVVIYPVLLPQRTELIVGRDGVLSSYPIPVDSDTLTAEVRAFRTSLERRTSRQYLTHASTLYDWLIRPIGAVLEQGETPATLVFVPDGALRTIPFGALRDRESKQFLIEKHPIAVTPSLSLTNPRPIGSNVRVLAAGISEAVGGYPELKAVENEIAEIRNIYPGNTLMNDEFGVENLRKELTGIPYGIVHISSHGEFGGQASENFLLAYDGHVSMDRLAAFVGATRFRADQPLELLTLSACESAAGDDRAALGLAGVALRAGARSALATLWSVNDQATAELVVDFYGNLHSPDVSRAQALQQAQIKMLSTRHYRHPGYWAPFLLISNWL